MLVTPIIFVSAEMCPPGTTTPYKINGELCTISDGSDSNIPDGSDSNEITRLKNPLNNGIDDIPSFITAVIKIVLYVGIPIVALAIIYTGFLFVEAQGNAEKITKAKKALVYTLIGAVLLLGAFVIAEAIVSTVDDIKSTTT